VEVALNPEELDMDTAAMQAKYEETMREQQSQIEKEDLSDMVAEHAAKQSKVSIVCEEQFQVILAQNGIMTNFSSKFKIVILWCLVFTISLPYHHCCLP
jgi:hypothetical protein